MNTELNLLVAEHVMGFEIVKTVDEQGVVLLEAVRNKNKNSLFDTVVCPDYSGSMSVAWLVVEKLSAEGKYIRLSNITGRGNWRCATPGSVTDFFKNAPEAICHAALKYVGYRGEL